MMVLELTGVKAMVIFYSHPRDERIGEQKIREDLGGRGRAGLTEEQGSDGECVYSACSVCLCIFYLNEQCIISLRKRISMMLRSIL